MAVDEEKAVHTQDMSISGDDSARDDNGTTAPLPPLAHEDTHASQSSHTHQYGRLHRLLHPSGKIFHVVRTHHDIPAKRAAVLQEVPRPADSDFEIVVHGSDAHIGAVRDCHAQQAQSRDALVDKNRDLLSRYDTVRGELDRLSRELRDLTDHAVSLDASFDKWGYSAHLRTHGDRSETSSLHETENGNGEQFHDASKHQDDRNLTAMRFFKAPVIRQYFHKGLIWRSPQSSEVVSFELFVDLVYVAVIDAIGEVAVSNASGASFLHYIIVFGIASKVFTDILTVMNWFEINDIFGRLCVMFIIVCLYAFASNTEFFFETTFTPGVAFYLASRAICILWFFFAAYLVPMVRPVLILHALIAIVGVVLWIGAIHIEYPNSLAIIFIALFIDNFGNQIIWPFVRRVKTDPNNPRKTRWESIFEYVPAVNIEHRVERTGAFISLVIGYSVIKIFFQSRVDFPMNAFLGKGILGLVQAFLFNWIYFEIDNWGIHLHAIRRSWISTAAWNTAHLPFSAAFILASSTMSELVLAHDCSDANPEDLAETYANGSIGEIEPTLRWFYCGGLGIALMSMAAISLSHRHKQLPNPKLRKRTRILYRIAVSIVIICLPLAESLSSLDLITITTCLIASVLMLDIFGLSCAGDEFFTGGFCKERKRQTKYTARCRLSERRKREMRAAVQRGDRIDLADVLKRDGSVSSLASADTRVEGDLGAGVY